MYSFFKDFVIKNSVNPLMYSDLFIIIIIIIRFIRFIHSDLNPIDLPMCSDVFTIIRFVKSYSSAYVFLSLMLQHCGPSCLALSDSVGV